MHVQNYIEGNWSPTSGGIKELKNAVNGELVSTIGEGDIDCKAILEFARSKGGPALRKLTFHERARMLKALALYLMEKKAEFYKVSAATGATKIDSWIDIEGGIGNLFSYSSKGRRELPNTTFLVDGNPELISKEGTFIGHHICVPKEGCAVNINAFNFPVWGMLEKIAVNLLAGMPAIVKPSKMTSYLTEVVFKHIIESKIFPPGSLQLVCGGVSGIFDYLDSQDVVSFTGSAATGRKLKSHPNILNHSILFNMEADSLNCCILGPDARPGTPDFDIFIKEVAKEMTVKAGQKCTAIRRIMVPREFYLEVGQALKDRLAKVVMGDPSIEGVRMGPLAFRDHLFAVKEKILALKKSCGVLLDGEIFTLRGGSKEKGAFLGPTLLTCEGPRENLDIHQIEAFGPVATLMPYQDVEEAICLARMGHGSLVGSVVTSNDNFACEMVLGCAPYHGRLLILNNSCAKESTGHGSPLPQLVHGGPGRAGGGEEMGGIRGLYHFMQRTAIQGHPNTISKIVKVYQKGADKKVKEIHPFRKYFEELEIGESHHTHKRTITETDIVNFSNLSWDHFYAHTDITSLNGTLFEERVAHGYFILSASAGLFVDPGRGPVLANYGLDEFRFVKPVYAGSTINVHLTVKEKIDQENREGEIPRGIVKWLVEVFDQGDELAALGTILTLVEKKIQKGEG